MKNILFIFVYLMAFGTQKINAQMQPPPGIETLLSRSTTHVAKSGASRTVVEIKNRMITNEAATQHSNFAIPLLDPGLRFKLLNAQVTTDGQVFKVKAGEVLTTVTPHGNYGLTELRQIVIPFPQVKPQSVIEVSYELERQPLIGGMFSEVAGMSNADFAEVEEQVFVSEKPLKFVTQGLDQNFSIRESKEGGKFLLTLAPTEAGRKMAGKSQKSIMMILTTADSWLQINKALAEKYERAVKAPLPTPFADIAAQAKPLKTFAEKIETVGRGLQKQITYSGDWRTTKGEYFPAGHSSVVKQGRGDCKDYANSMAAILRNLGFTSYVALTFRRSPYHQQKALQEMAATANFGYFNHAIVWAKDPSGKVWWIDPTNPVVIAEVLSNDLLGNFALVLDGVSSSTQMLPTKNSEPSKLTLSQTFRLKPDNSVEVEGTLSANAVANNSLSMIEKFAGAEAMKKTFAALINRANVAAINYKTQSTANSTTYSINASALDWTREKVGTSRQVFVGHIVQRYTQLGAGLGEWDFGQNEIVDFTTRIKSQVAVDPVDHECHGRSRWIDFDRKVTVIGGDTEIKDRVTVKERFVTEEQFKGAEFGQFFSDASECDGASAILTFMAPPESGSPAAKLAAQKGPPVEKMTDVDAVALEDSPNLKLRGYQLTKRFRYYSQQIEKEPKNLGAYAKLGQILVDMGYQSGDDYNRGYLDAAMETVERGLTLASGEFNGPLLAQRATIFTHMGKTPEATKDFVQLVAKTPRTFETALVGYYMNQKLARLGDAEKWLTLAISVADRPARKRLARNKLAFTYSDQNRHAEALEKLNENIKDPGVTAWDWHNAAREYGFLKDYDKCIEYDKKALEIMDFGVARKNIAWALEGKSLALAPKPNDSREEATKKLEEAESLLLEALKWDAKNESVHLGLIDLRLSRYGRDRTPENYDRVKAYIDRTVTSKAADTAKIARKINLLKIFSTLDLKNDTRAPAAASAPTK